MSDAKATKRQLTIKTGVVKRLTKEEKTYIQEAKEQEDRIAQYEKDGKEDWQIKQQRKVLVDCQQMIPDCRKRLDNAKEDLQSIIDGLDSDVVDTDEARAAKEALNLT